MDNAERGGKMTDRKMYNWVDPNVCKSNTLATAFCICVQRWLIAVQSMQEI